jgi:hypothetical protein
MMAISTLRPPVHPDDGHRSAGRDAHQPACAATLIAGLTGTWRNALLLVQPGDPASMAPGDLPARVEAAIRTEGQAGTLERN